MKTKNKELNYLVDNIKIFYTKIEILADKYFTGEIKKVIECNSKYELDVYLSAVDKGSYISYDLKLTIYKKENKIAEHSLQLSIDNPKNRLFNPTYIGQSIPCSRGVLRTDLSYGFTLPMLKSLWLQSLITKFIHKDELISAYCDVIPTLINYLNKLVDES